jgi:Fanconi anemia group M protein
MIIIDNRELRSGLAKELFKRGVDFIAKQLSIGDYIIGDVCIERKSAKDFYDSIIDKRIFSQMRSLKSNYDKRIIIVEGNGCERNIHPNAVKGLIASIIIDYKVPIIFCEDEKETADFLQIIEKRVEKNVATISDNKKPKNELEIAKNMLSLVPGIGLKTADKIINHFKSIKNSLLASEAELSIVIGEKSAKSVKGFIDKEF